jgi:hypothetical protein
MGRQQRRASKRQAAARKAHVPKEIVLYAHRGGGSIPPRPANLDMPDHKYKKWYAKVTQLLGQGKTVSDLGPRELKEYIRDFSAAGALSPQMHQKLLEFSEKKGPAATAKRAERKRKDVVYRGTNADVWKNPSLAIVARAPRQTNMMSNAMIQRTNEFRGIDPKTGIRISNAVGDVGSSRSSIVDGGVLMPGKAHSYSFSMRNSSGPARYYGSRFNMPANPRSAAAAAELEDIGKVQPADDRGMRGSEVGSRVWKRPRWHPQQLVQPPVQNVISQKVGPGGAALSKRSFSGISEETREVIPRGRLGRMRTGDYVLFNPAPPAAPTVAANLPVVPYLSAFPIITGSGGAGVGSGTAATQTTSGGGGAPTQTGGGGGGAGSTSPRLTRSSGKKGKKGKSTTAATTATPPQSP